MLITAELKRRGISFIEQAHQDAPVHLLKRYQSASLVITPQQYHHLQWQASIAPVSKASALQSLLNPAAIHTSLIKSEINAEIGTEYDW